MKGFLAVIAGYFVMALTVFGCLTIAYMILGVNCAFEPGTYNVSMTWCVIMLIVGVVSALLGGLVCRKISGHENTVRILAAVVIVLGISSAIPSFTLPISVEARPETVRSMEAMVKAVTPRWVAVANIVIGAVGVLIGGKAYGK